MISVYISSCIRSSACAATPKGKRRRLAPDDASGIDGEVIALESWLHIEVDRETNPAALEVIRADVEQVLADVRVSTSDWLKMLATLQSVCAGLDSAPPPVDGAELIEGREFLQWLGDQHFTFLAYRAYDLTADDTLTPVPDSGLGLLRNAPANASANFARLPAAIRAKAHEPTLLVLTKANARSTVHRPTYLDYVGVKRFDAHGEVIGEHRFLGLYTSSTYMSSPTDIPVLRTKVASVVERAGFLPGSHSDKDLLQILETYPRDDLFQTDADELYDTTMAILRVQERRQVRLFVHREPYGRFVSCLVYLPRDRYTTDVRVHIAALLMDGFGGASYEWNTRLSESVLARLHYVLRLDPMAPHEVDVDHLQSQIRLTARSWLDDLRDALVATHGEEAGLDELAVWHDAFPARTRTTSRPRMRSPTSPSSRG